MFGDEHMRVRERKRDRKIIKGKMKNIKTKKGKEGRAEEEEGGS